MEDIIKLKPCPFCGAVPQIEVEPLRGYEPCARYTIKCHICGCEPHYDKDNTVYYSVSEILKCIANTWNRRIQD